MSKAFFAGIFEFLSLTYHLEIPCRDTQVVSLDDGSLWVLGGFLDNVSPSNAVFRLTERPPGQQELSTNIRTLVTISEPN